MKQYLTKRNMIIGAVAVVIVSSSILIYIFSNTGKNPDPDLINYEITEFAQFDTGGDTHDVEVHYGIAFISDMRADQLVILNVSDPINPQLISTFQTEDNHGLTVVAKSPTDMICYLACDDMGLDIINVSEPAFPVLLSNYDPTSAIDELTIRDDLAYLVSQNKGLEVINISDPAVPIKLGSITYGNVGTKVNVVLKEGCAYLTDQNRGLFVVNITDPANMSIIGRYEDSFGFGFMDIEGDLLAIPDERTIKIFNVSDPTTPWLITEITDAGTNIAVSIVNELLYVAGNSPCFEIYDISDLTAVEKVVSSTGLGTGVGLWVENDFIYLALMSNDFRILQLKQS